MSFNIMSSEILLDSPTGAYYSGQMVNGRVVFDISSVTQIRGVHLTAKGYCNVHWTTSHSRREQDRTIHYTVPHDSYEEYICLKLYLFGSKNAEHTLNPGKYDYPFSFQLPDSCPSTFDGSHGHVRYEVRAFIDQPYKTEELFREFQVHAPLDLNQIPCREPVSFDFDQTYCCWCCSSGSSETVVKIPVRGYCPGQVIPIEITCQNRSSVEIDAIKFTIKKDITYHAIHEPDTKNERETVDKLSKGPISPHTDRTWTVEMPVPEGDVYNLSTCSFIDLTYEFKVTVEPSGCHSNDEDSCELIIGTIPLAGFQDNLPNPLPDQLPLPEVTVPPQNYPLVNIAPYPQPVIAQPVTSYPSNTPFPANPYPATQPSPYPNQAPYPQNTPYPTPQPSVAPYPAVQPYPSPQPGVPPYPQPGVPPYSQPNNTPYPTPNNGPYPTSPAPQPANPPYPVATIAHQGNPLPQSSPLLKTGNLGFVTAGSEPASMPLLPVGAMPYPPRTNSPFVGASAPADAPATPTEPAEKSALANSSPYNPAFMNTDSKEETK